MTIPAPGTPKEPASWREVFGRRARLTVGLIVLETIAAVQLLIVITIMPVVVRDLGGFSLYGWAFSASALAAMIALPATAHWADRWGPARALMVVLVVFVAGTIMAAAAPTMLVLVVGRFLQGWGLGAEYAVSLGAVAKTYPEAHRPRVLALLSAAWVIPSLVGPSVGVLFASTIGWRWAFLASLPILAVAAWMVLPELRKLPKGEATPTPVPLRWVLQLGAGAAGLLVALTGFHWWSIPLAVVALLVVLPALRRILPPGSLEARAGLPSAVAASFVLNFSFFAVDGFVPLLLTHARHRSVAMGGVAVTAASVAWAAGTWWQSRAVANRGRAPLVILGAAMMIAGSAGVWLSLLHAVPLVVLFGSWTIAGLGMGVAYPTISLVAMEQAEPGGETVAVASVQLTEALGAALGPGLGGSAIAIAAGAGASIGLGLSVAFAMAIAVGLLLFPAATRLPRDSVRHVV